MSLTESKTLTEKSLVAGIRKDLGLSETVSPEILEEAYVASPKHYDMRTELLSEKNKLKHRELYEGYVQTLNRVSAELDAADRKNVGSAHSEYRSLKIDESYAMNAVYLHELFFANVSDVHSEIQMDSLAYMRLSRDYGTFEAWQYDLIACSLASRGWAVCAYNTFLQRYVNYVIDSHDQHVTMGSYPVIVLDMFEHSYYRDYTTDKKSYIYAMMKEFDWSIIEDRFKCAEKIAQALR
jgi:Fe-Mn family superoxide dismutase